MMTRVRADVYAATGREQRPWVSTSLLGEVYLAPEKTEVVETEPAPTGSSAIELSFWQSIAASSDPAEYAAYLDAFPDGIFATLARSRIATLTVTDTQPTEDVPSPDAVTESALLENSAEATPSEPLAETGLDQSAAQEPEPAEVPLVPSDDQAVAETPTDIPAPTQQAQAPSASGAEPRTDSNPVPSEAEDQVALFTPKRPLPKPSIPEPLAGPEGKRECPECPVMIPLAGGAFMMGSPAGMGESTEHPQREITLAPYSISRSEITVAQFRAFVEDSGYQPAAGCFKWTATGKMRKSAGA